MEKTPNNECVDTQVRNYDGLKMKTTQSILPDPEITKQHIQRGNIQYFTYTIKALHGPLAYVNTYGVLMPLRFNGQRFSDEPMKSVKRKPPVMQNPACNEETLLPPQASIFSAPAAKYVLPKGIELDDDCLASNQVNESDTDTFDNNSDSGDSDDEVCT